VEMDVAIGAVAAELADFVDGVVVDGAGVLVAASGEEGQCGEAGDRDEGGAESRQGFPLSTCFVGAKLCG
jgi:hypothetical protein